MPTSAAATKLLKKSRASEEKTVANETAPRAPEGSESNTLTTAAEPSRMGRPKKLIDDKEFDTLCSVGCTLAEITAFFECSMDTIERYVGERLGITFREYSQQKMRVRFTSLRRGLFVNAAKGNLGAQIWLSKQYLGMKDKSEFSGDPQAPLAVETKLAKDKLRAKLIGNLPVKATAKKVVAKKRKTK